MRRRGVLFAALLLTLAVDLGSSVAEAQETRLATQLPDGFWATASGLFPRRPKLSQLEALRLRKAPDTLDILVVGCDFSDSLMWGRDIADFPGWPTQTRRGDRIPGTDIPQFAAHDSTFFDAQMRKVSDYFETVSFGQFTMNWEVHGKIVNLPRPMRYYGDPDSSGVRVVGMAQAILDSLDAEVDFSQYDTLVLIHAGAGQETDVLGDSPEQLFSNYLDQRDFEDAFEAGVLSEPMLSTEEGPLGHVLILPESESQDSFPEAGFSGFFGTRGVYCFEFGLRLGMINMGDFTPSPNPDSQGIGNFGLMGYGLFTGLGIVPSAPSAFNRWLMGWVPAVEVRADADIRLGAINAAGDAVSDTLLVKIPISDREYWLVEYRLQDPDGDLFFSFDDLNDNNLPDYFDADSGFANGWPTSSYDPLTDTLESTLGAEWDWFMSENTLRSADRCQRAGGSGLYIWHIDERVIRDSIEGGGPGVNADKDHRGVDVEEADGIQDLDSPRPSPYFLGWDGDAWRDHATGFGPDTNPATDTADGTPTGVRIDAISNPILSTLPRDENGNCTGYVYAPAMQFRVTFGPTESEGPVSRVALAEPAPHGDVRLVDLGAGFGDPTPDGRADIVMSGDAGTVFAFHGDLTEWRPGSAGVLATAIDGGDPVVWNGPPAIGDVDGDGVADAVLASASAVHAFSTSSGAELRDGDADAATIGVLWRPGTGELVGAPLLDGGGPDRTAPPLRIVQLWVEDGITRLVRLDASGAAVVAETGPDHPASAGPGGVVLAGNATDGWFLAYSWRGAATSGITSTRADLTTSTTIETAQALDADLLAYDFGPGSAGQIATLDSLGVAHRFVGGSAETGIALPSVPRSALSGGPSADGGIPLLAAAAGHRLVALDRGLNLLDGFPYGAQFQGESFRAGTVQSAPLLIDLNGDGRTELLWHDPVGRLHAVDQAANLLPGWPRRGPAEPTGSMAIADVDGDGDLDLVVAGRFDAIDSADVPGRSVVVRPRGELAVFALGVDAGAFAPWVQGRGGPLQQGRQPADSRIAGRAGGGATLEPGTLWVGPNPARGDRVRVRARLLRDASVRVGLYSLEGELVAEAAPFAAAGGAVIDLPLAIDTLVSGYYLCRVEAGGDVVVGAFTVVK